MPNWLEVVPTAAVVSAAVTIVLRWFDRPRPELRLEGRMTRRDGDEQASSEGLVWAYTSLINIGDGDAYDVRLYGSGCDVAVPSREVPPDHTAMWTHRIPVVRAGDNLKLTLGVRETPNGDEAIVITWSKRPRRSFRARRRFELKDMPTEFFFPPVVMPIVTIPGNVRRTNKLEKLSPRANPDRYFADEAE